MPTARPVRVFREAAETVVPVATTGATTRPPDRSPRRVMGKWFQILASWFRDRQLAPRLLWFCDMPRLGAITFALLLPLVATAGAPKPPVATKRVGNSTVFWHGGKAFLFTPAKSPRSKRWVDNVARDEFLDQLDLFDKEVVPGPLPPKSTQGRGTIRPLRQVARMVNQAELSRFLDEWLGIWDRPDAGRPSVLPPGLWQPMHALMAKARGVLPPLALKPDTIGKTPNETEALRLQAAHHTASASQSFKLAPQLDETQRAELQRRIEEALYKRTTKGARLHRLTPALAKRLPVGVRTVISGVAELEGGATGILVWREPGSRRALLMTNEHVGAKTDIIGHSLRFFDGSSATVVRVAAGNQAQDYKLLEIDLPLESPAVPVEIDGRGPNTSSPRGLRGSAEVYSIGGGTSLRPAANPADAVAGPPSTQNAIAAAVLNLEPPLHATVHPTKPQPLFKMPNANFTISTGRTVDDGAIHTETVNKVATDVVRTDLPNMPGMSGAGLFERGTNLMIGLHTMGNASPAPAASGKTPDDRPPVGWIESAVPIDLVIRNLWLAKQAEQLPKESLDLVEAMLVHIDRNDIARGPRPAVVPTVTATGVAATTP